MHVSSSWVQSLVDHTSLWKPTTGEQRKETCSAWETSWIQMLKRCEESPTWPILDGWRQSRWWGYRLHRWCERSPDEPKKKIKFLCHRGSCQYHPEFSEVIPQNKSNTIAVSRRPMSSVPVTRRKMMKMLMILSRDRSRPTIICTERGGGDTNTGRKKKGGGEEERWWRRRKVSAALKELKTYSDQTHGETCVLFHVKRPFWI